ncbi:K02A2.6-like, partial [Cordylochernes scorpioides]
MNIKKEATTQVGSFFVQHLPRNPSMFSGEGVEDPRSWLKGYERMAKHNQWDETLCLANVYFYLTGTALKWFENNEESIQTWTEFMSQLENVFGKNESSRLRAEKILKTRAQLKGESTGYYIQDVLRLCKEVDPQMNEEDKISHLMKGIAEELYQALLPRDVHNTEQFVTECRRIESLHCKRVTPTKYERLPNVASLSDHDDRADLSSMIRQIVREEVQRALGSTQEEPKISTIEDTVKEEIGRTLAPISKPRRSSPQKERPREFYNNSYVAQTIRPHPEPRYPKQGGRRDTNEWRTTEGKPICFHCGRPGHVVRYCRDRRREYEEGQNWYYKHRDRQEPRTFYNSRSSQEPNDNLPRENRRRYRSPSPYTGQKGQYSSPDRRPSQSPRRSQKCLFEDTPKNSSPLYSELEYRIEPASIQLIEVASRDIPNDAIVIAECRKELLLERELTAPSSVISLTNNRDKLWVVNWSPYPKLIPQGMHVADSAVIEDSQLCTLADCNQVETEAEHSEDPKISEFFIDDSLDESQKEKLRNLLKNYMDIFEFSKRKQFKDVNVKHRINTGDHLPTKQRPYRVAPRERQIIQDEVNKMEKLDIIQPSESPWASPVVLIRKKDGSWRFCVDYRRLNKIIKKDVYPLPRIDDTLDCLRGARFYSSMDLQSGYWQIDVEESDREKTAFITPDGLYEFKVMAFGLCNAPATFERMIDNLLKGLKWTICLCYLDDIIVFSDGFEEHLRHLQLVLNCLKKAGLCLNSKKCKFGAKTITVLGHEVSENGIRPDQEKISSSLRLRYAKVIEGNCQRRKHQPQLPSGHLQPIPVPEVAFEKVGMDLLGRFPTSEGGNRWIIVCTDYLTKYAITKALPTSESMEVAKFFIEDVILKHGAPRELITDRGRNFRSLMISDLNNQCRITHRKTTAYHPQTNGLTERLNKTIADMLSMIYKPAIGCNVAIGQHLVRKGRKNTGKDELEANLQRFLFARRAFPQTVVKESPAELLMKRSLRSRFSTQIPKMGNPGEVFQENMRRQEQFSTGCKSLTFKRHINKLRSVMKKQKVEERNLILPNTSRERLTIGMQERKFEEEIPEVDEECEGADSSNWENTQDLETEKADKNLFAVSKKIEVNGMFQAFLESKRQKCEESIYIVKGVARPLLSCRASEILGLVRRIKIVEDHAPTKLDPMLKFPKLFTGLGKIDIPYEIKLKEEAKPYSIYTPRRVPIPLMKELQMELERMTSNGVIEKVEGSSEWCSPMVLVAKPSGKLRICVDLSILNQNILREIHPIPVVEHTLAQLKGADLFTKLDADSGFWQIPLSSESSALTTFITPFGRFRFRRLPFCISSAPVIFQKRMGQILEGLEGTLCHMDDILVYGSCQEEHDKRLETVLTRLSKLGLTLNKDKCKFAVTTIEFLGHQIDPNGIQVDSKRKRAILEFPKPRSVKELKQFLGMVNFSARFVPNLAEISHPLNKLLSKKEEWIWEDDQDRAFDQIKKSLTSAQGLALSDPSLPITVSADASSFGLGAVIWQTKDGLRQVIAYASRTLSETEKCYAQIEKEALAITWACEKFKQYIQGLVITLETDHKPLVPIFTSKNIDDLTPRIQRLRLRIMRYSYKIVHTPGKNFIVADALSRSPRMKVGTQELEEELCAYVQQVVSFMPISDVRVKEIKESQDKDQVIQNIIKYTQEGWPERTNVSMSESQYWPAKDDFSVENGILLKGSRYVIPENIRKGYPEIARLEDMTSASVIVHCKSIFARHGIPLEVRSDNGPQFGSLFKEFAQDYGFTHVTSSPRYPQSNGFIESFVKIVKERIGKLKDPYLALLAYRATSLANGFSPAELIMGRRIRTTIPTPTKQHQPPNLKNLKNQEAIQREKQKYYFDRAKGVRELPPLE